jgi:hypothetical protein
MNYSSWPFSSQDPDLASLQGGCRPVFIALWRNTSPWSNWLKKRRRCNPRIRRKNILEAPDKWAPQGTRWHGGGAGLPHLSSSWGALRCGVFWCPLKPSGIVFVTIKFDSIWRFDPLASFLIKSCWKHRFTKTCGIYQYKPPIIWYWSIFTIYAR